MKLHFLGGAGEVGRSACLVETEQVNVLMDCGVKASHPHQFPLFDMAKRPHAVALSHAHLDHSGALPTLYQHQAIPLLATFPTIPLVQMLLEDTQKIAAQENEPPFFTDSDVKKMQRNIRPLPYRQDYQFSDKSHLKFYDAGHILGSAQIYYRTREGSVLYTGDFNATETQLHKPAELPKEQVDVLVTESTYGHALHPDRPTLEKRFADAVREAIEDEFAVLIPAFAIGRTQEILTALEAHGLAEHVVLDGMGIKASDIMMDFPSYLKNPQLFARAYAKTRKVDDAGTRKGSDKSGNVIIATAGMFEGGPVMSHVANFLKRGQKAKIFLTGFQVKGTKGRRLLEEGVVRLQGKSVKWPWEVRFFDFSAHADAKGLLRHAKKLNPKQIFCMHGENENLEGAYKLFSEQGFDTYVPRLGERVEV